MGERDIAERNLEEHNDIFADIVNAFFLMRGLRGYVVRPEELQEAKGWSAYTSSFVTSTSWSWGI